MTFSFPCIVDRNFCTVINPTLMLACHGSCTERNQTEKSDIWDLRVLSLQTVNTNTQPTPRLDKARIVWNNWLDVCLSIKLLECVKYLLRFNIAGRQGIIWHAKNSCWQSLQNCYHPQLGGSFEIFPRSSGGEPGTPGSAALISTGLESVWPVRDCPVQFVWSVARRPAPPLTVKFVHFFFFDNFLLQSE